MSIVIAFQEVYTSYLLLLLRKRQTPVGHSSVIGLIFIILGTAPFMRTSPFNNAPDFSNESISGYLSREPQLRPIILKSNPSIAFFFTIFYLLLLNRASAG